MQKDKNTSLKDKNTIAEVNSPLDLQTSFNNCLTNLKILFQTNIYAYEI